MNKSNHFTGSPIIKQILNFLPRSLVNRTAVKEKANHRYKKFFAYDHLVAMIVTALSGCTSLRELETIYLACEGKLSHFGVNTLPKRSTISDANKRRKSDFFAKIYFQLYQRYRKLLPDTCLNEASVKHLKIIDSTTFKLFSDILQGTGRKAVSGKQKGGIKLHAMIDAQEDVPSLVRLTPAKVHDQQFLSDLTVPKGSVLVFDLGYTNYPLYQKWTKEGIWFVTRLRRKTAYQLLETNYRSKKMVHGVMEDKRIKVKKTGQELRLIWYYDREHDKLFEFLTNNFEWDAKKVADIYKNRWQIELMFKRLKQNFPLKYFLGDSKNAIEIQIWTSLIVQLICKVIQAQAKRRWAFSNLVSVIRYHLMTYIHLFKFLEKPGAHWAELTTRPKSQLELFSSA